MSVIDLSLYLVLDPDLCGGPEGMIETARVAAQHGVSVVQLRAPAWKKRQWLDTAFELKCVLDPMNVPLIINDHVDIAMAVDAAGVHVGQADMPPSAVRKLIGPDKILGLSITSVEQLRDAPVDQVDYYGIGPVFPTGTKLDAAPATGLQAFKAMTTACELPVVAIGGIKLGHCAALMQAGAKGVAVVSAICGQEDMAEVTKNLRMEIDQAI